MTDCAQNTDRELWRKVPGDYYSPSIHVTEGGGIGIDIGGFVIVKPVEWWHEMAKKHVKESVALSNVLYERKRQDAKWGEQNHPPLLWLAILGEEFGEACKAAIEPGCLPLIKYRDEMVHVAAVALAAVESFDRGKWAGTYPAERMG